MNVFVEPGNIKANIKGGDVQRVSSGCILALDASSSYDEDTEPTAIHTNALSFLWTFMKLHLLLDDTTCNN